MNQPWTTWLLAGALAASLTWQLWPARAPASCCDPLDLGFLELSEEQRRDLAAWKQDAADRSCTADSEAQTELAELVRAMRDPATPPEELRELAREVGDARARSLEACVESIVQVRRVLTEEQLGALLERCCASQPARGACGE
jgi:hypothetical protein